MGKFSAHVTHISNNRVKCPTLSNIHIHINNTVFYTAVLGGQYTEQQALREFYKNPKAFKPVPVVCPNYEELKREAALAER